MCAWGGPCVCLCVRCVCVCGGGVMNAERESWWRLAHVVLLLTRLLPRLIMLAIQWQHLLCSAADLLHFY